MSWREGGRGSALVEAARGWEEGMSRRASGLPERNVRVKSSQLDRVEATNASPVQPNHPRKQRGRLTHLISHHRIQLNPLSKLVRLATHHHRHRIARRQHGYTGCSRSGVEGSVGEEGVGSDEDEVGSWQDGGEGGEESVGARDGVGAEGEKERFSCKLRGQGKDRRG